MINSNRQSYCKGFVATVILGAILSNPVISFGVFFIDDFSNPSSERNIKSTGGNQEQWTDPDSGSYSDSVVIGGIRDGSLGCENYDNTSNVDGTIGTGNITVNSSGNSTPSLYLSYDGTREWGLSGNDTPETKRFNGTFDVAKDFSDYTDIELQFSNIEGFEFGDGGSGGFNDVYITLLQGSTDEAGINDQANWYSYDVATAGEYGGINNLVNSSETQIFSMSLADFKSESGGVSFDSAVVVQAVQLHICSEDTGSSYTLDQIQVVPEPRASLVIAIAGIAIFYFRRLYKRVAM